MAEKHHSIRGGLRYSGAVTVVAKNRRARFDYDILETIEAGIVLTGGEVKSCRAHGVNLAGAYVSFVGGKAALKQASIAPYRYARAEDAGDPKRERALLLSKSQMERLQSFAAEKGVTIIPLEVVAKKFVKVLLGVARGRKRFDKRSAIREREMGRKLREGREV